jgi:hypothetical protein
MRDNTIEPIPASGADAPINRVSDTGKPVLSAFPAEQTELLGAFVKALAQENVARAEVNAKITARLSDERPWSGDKLKQAGLGWKSNFTTRPLATLASKVTGRFPRAINTARFLTSSELPAHLPNARIKTEFFRREVTNVIRADSRWPTLVDDLANENVLFGYAAAGCISDNEWFPTLFRQNNLFLPVKTRQAAKEMSCCVVRQVISTHAAFSLLTDAKEARDTRWNQHKLATAINNAAAEARRSQPGTDFGRMYADLQRQLSLATTYTGDKTVELWHVLATELDGKVSHYILDSGYCEMFRAERRFETIDQVLAFFAFERGDGSMHGSKGVGRLAYNLSVVLDRARNDSVDKLYMAGKVIVQGPEANMSRFKAHVIGNVLAFSDEWEVTTHRIDTSVDASISLDRYLKQLLEEMTGSVSPITVEGERVTAEQIRAIMSREDERSDDILSRWIMQLGFLLSIMQRRLCNPRCKDPAAKALRERLGLLLSPAEIKLLSEAPALRVVSDFTEMQRQAIVIATTEGRGNPHYDQWELEREKLSAQVSADFADRVLLPAQDGNAQAEQTRLQLLENNLLINGQPVPVSSRDSHFVHLAVLAPVLESAIEQAVQNPTAEAVVEACLEHLAAHVADAKQLGLSDPQLPVFEQLVKQGQAVLESLKELNTEGQPLPAPDALAQPQPQPGYTEDTPPDAPIPAPSPPPA